LFQIRQKGGEKDRRWLLLANLLKSDFENIALGLLLLLFELSQFVKKLASIAWLEAETATGYIIKFDANQTAEEIFKQDSVPRVVEHDWQRRMVAG